MDSKTEPVIHASEVGQFAFCRSAWWLGSVRGLPSTNVEARARGRALHQEHGRRAYRAVWLQRAAVGAWGLALILIAIGILLVSTAAGGGL